MIGDKMNFKHILLFIVIINFIGCSKSFVSHSTKPDEYKATKVQELPSWILNPNQKNHICDIGSSKLKKDILATKKIAKIKAKRNISEQMKVFIISQTINTQKCDNLDCSTSFNSIIQQESSNILEGDIFYPNEHIDKEDEVYYVRACIKINTIS